MLTIKNGVQGTPYMGKPAEMLGRKATGLRILEMQTAGLQARIR